jgi:hypothetical protein
MRPPPLDLDRFSWDTADASDFADTPADKKPTSKGRLPRPQGDELYLGGPIPLGWLSRAAALPGRALHVGNALWFEALCHKAKSAAVRLPMKTRRRFGLAHARTYRRALQTLVAAGLVKAQGRPGRSPVITILPASRRRGRG